MTFRVILQASSLYRVRLYTDFLFYDTYHYFFSLFESVYDVCGFVQDEIQQSRLGLHIHAKTHGTSIKYTYIPATKHGTIISTDHTYIKYWNIFTNHNQTYSFQT